MGHHDQDPVELFQKASQALADTLDIVLLFLPNAASIYINVNFQVKMILLVLAGINMFIFELVTARSVGIWDTTLSPPNAARVAGLLSIGFWMTIIVFGRLIGFTSVADDPFAFI